MTQNVRPNRLRYSCRRKEHSNKKLHLSLKEIERWVTLCKENNLMPQNIGENFIKNGVFDIDISNISINMMYAYLCAARYIQDEPFFVRAMLHFHDDLGIGFFTSLAVATKFCVTNSGHHLLPFYRDYSLVCNAGGVNNKKNISIQSFDLSHVCRLHRFLNGGDKGIKMKNKKSNDTYNLHSACSSIKLKKGDVQYKVAREKLAHAATERTVRNAAR